MPIEKSWVPVVNVVLDDLAPESHGIYEFGWSPHPSLPKEIIFIGRAAGCTINFWFRQHIRGAEDGNPTLQNYYDEQPENMYFRFQERRSLMLEFPYADASDVCDM